MCRVWFLEENQKNVVKNRVSPNEILIKNLKKHHVYLRKPLNKKCQPARNVGSRPAFLLQAYAHHSRCCYRMRPIMKFCLPKGSWDPWRQRKFRFGPVCSLVLLSFALPFVLHSTVRQLAISNTEMTSFTLLQKAVQNLVGKEEVCMVLFCVCVCKPLITLSCFAQHQYSKLKSSKAHSPTSAPERYSPVVLSECRECV